MSGEKRSLTLEECVARGGHCYESINIVYATYPPQHPEQCKHCPASRVAIPQEPWTYRDTTPPPSSRVSS